MPMIHDEAGTTSIEYALIGSLVSIAILAALSNLGSSLAFLYDIVAALVSGAL